MSLMYFRVTNHPAAYVARPAQCKIMWERFSYALFALFVAYNLISKVGLMPETSHTPKALIKTMKDVFNFPS